MKKNLVKRIAVMAMVGAMALSGTAAVAAANTTVAYAQEYISVKEMSQTVKIASPGANLREAPSKDSAVVNVVGGGTKLTLTGRAYRNGSATMWYQVNTKNYITGKKQVAYVCSSTFASSNNNTSSTAKTATTAAVKKTNRRLDAGRYTVSGTNNYLAVRTYAGYDASNIITKLYNGESFTVEYNAEDGYVYGYTSDGVAGFVNAAYLTKAASQSSASVDNGTYTVSGTSNFLAVRTYAGYDASNIITQLYNGDTFTVEYTTGNGYAYGYTSDGVAGFVNADYLR